MKKYFFNFCLAVLFFLPITVFADDVIYDKALDDMVDYIAYRGVATSDGGYAVLALKNNFGNSYNPDDPDREKMFVIKYSANGEKQWVNSYSIPNPPEDCRDTWQEYNSETGQNETRCGTVNMSEFIGFTELDNGNLIIIGNYFKLLIGNNGNLISTLSMDSKFYDYLGFRCDNEGEGTACVAIGVDEYSSDNDEIIGVVFRVNNDASIGVTYEIPSLQIVIADNAPKVGLPVSFFRNNDGNYVVETIEGIIPFVTIFDSNFNQISKNPVLIRDSSINIIRQIGSVFWITGQYTNNNYFGAYINYNGSYSFSKTSYVVYNSSLTNVVSEKIIAEAIVDIKEIQDHGIRDEETARLLLKSGAVGVIGLLDGFRDGRYISTFDADFYNILGNPNDNTIKYNFDFMRLDSNLEEIYRYQIVNGSSNDSNEDFLLGGMLSSVLRLKDGSDVVLTNIMADSSITGRHMKFAKKNVVLPTIESNDDVSFEKSVYEPGEVVKIQLRQKDGYYVDKIIVRDATGNEIEVDQDNQTFIMPDSDVTVEVKYRAIEQVDGGILTSVILSILALTLVGFLSIRYFKKKKPIGL